MKVVSNEALTKLIQLIKSSFIKVDDIVQTQEVTLADVAISGDYDDLINKPTIPTVNDATLTIQKNGSNVATFTANASSNVTANIEVPTVDQTYSASSTNAQSGVAVASAMSTKADDNVVVHKTGNETITGVKTFTSNVKVSKAAPYVDLYNTNITKGTISSSVQVARNAMTDKDGKYIAMTQYQYNIAGETQAVLRAYSPNNETDFAQISIWYPPTGDPYTYAPTPATSDNSTKIATTAYINAKFLVVTELPANPDPNTFYFIKE
jgi:hypothetical protein